MHLSDNAFHDWCMQEFPDLKRHTRHNIMLVGKRFGGVEFIQHQFPITVLYELAAPSVPDELVEDIMSLYSSTMAGFFGKFSKDCGISKDYAYKINRARKLQWTAKNFSHDAAEALLSAPDELRDEIVSLDNSNMAGFVGKFADDCGISYEYAKQLNRIRNTGCNPKNFSAVQGEKL